MPSVITQLTVGTEEDLNIVWGLTLQIKETTPYSFRELPDLKMIFSYNFYQQPKEILLKSLELIENMPCLPILPEELFFYSYPEILSCSNP